MRFVPFSYFCTCWNVTPSASPIFDWDMPSMRRRMRRRCPTCLSVRSIPFLGTGAPPAISNHATLLYRVRGRDGRRRICKFGWDFSGVGFSKWTGCCGAGLSGGGACSSCCLFSWRSGGLFALSVGNLFSQCIASLTNQEIVVGFCMRIRRSHTFVVCRLAAALRKLHVAWGQL